MKISPRASCDPAPIRASPLACFSPASADGYRIKKDLGALGLAPTACSGPGHTQGLFDQIGGNREPVGLGDRLLEFTCISPIGGVVQHLI